MEIIAILTFAISVFNLAAMLLVAILIIQLISLLRELKNTLDQIGRVIEFMSIHRKDV